MGSLPQRVAEDVTAAHCLGVVGWISPTWPSKESTVDFGAEFKSLRFASVVEEPSVLILT